MSDDGRALFLLGLDGEVADWEPGDEPILTAFARFLDVVLAGALASDDLTGVGDGTWLLTFAANGVALTALADPDGPDGTRFLEYLDRDHALAIAAELVDGDLDTLLQRPWTATLPASQFDFDRFHIAAALLDAAILDEIGELTAITRALVTEKAATLADLLVLPDASWAELAGLTTMIPTDAVDHLAPAWSDTLDAARTSGRALRPVDFARRITDAHLRHDATPDPAMVARFGGEVVTVTSDAGGTRIAASAAATLTDDLHALIAAFETEADHWRGGMTWTLGIGTYRLRAVDDGYVITTADLRSPSPFRAANGTRTAPATTTDDLSIVLALADDMTRLTQRAQLRPRRTVLDHPVACAPGWETAPVLDVTTFTGTDRIEVAPPSGHDEGPDRPLTGVTWEDVPLYRLLQRRPVVATAAGVAGPARVRVEDDSIRYVLGPHGDGSWVLHSRGPIWSLLRTVGWAPTEPTPWSSLPPLD